MFTTKFNAKMDIESSPGHGKQQKGVSWPKTERKFFPKTDRHTSKLSFVEGGFMELEF